LPASAPSKMTAMMSSRITTSVAAWIDSFTTHQKQGMSQRKNLNVSTG
jgi:hypothetical protein